MSRTKKTILWVVVGVVVTFVVVALLQSRPSEGVAEPPQLAEVPMRVYGRIEPAGGEVFVASPLTRRVVEIRAAEYDTVEQAQVLCVLESSVEQRAVEAAAARVGAAQRAWELSRDTYERSIGLHEKQGISDQEFLQARLRAELDSANHAAARKDAALARAQLEQLTLRSPVDGLVYKFDVRLGQTLTAGDNKSIILGAPGFWARLYVESFWRDRVSIGVRFTLFDAETHEELGAACVVRKSGYLGTREIRTEDTRERFDAEFQEVIVELENPSDGIPLGLYVLAELEESTWQ